MIENSYSKNISKVESITGFEYGYGGTEYIIVSNREDLRKIVEEPCLPACLFLYDKNIRTVNSSSNKRDIGGFAYIGIDYDSLDEKNKQILERLISTGEIERPRLSDNPQDRGGRDVMIRVPVLESDTVGRISDRFMKIISTFQEQDVLYGRHDLEPLMQEIIYRYSEALHPNENGEVEFEEFVDMVTSLYPRFVYDEELDIFWETQDLYDKHKRFQEKEIEQRNLQSNKNIEI